VMTRRVRDRRAVARYAGVTGSPDESGSRQREKDLAKAGKSDDILPTNNPSRLSSDIRTIRASASAFLPSGALFMRAASTL
jgi:hypothetical protein